MSQTAIRNDLRNVAIIAHVDHGKTTLVDGLLRTCGAFRENSAVEERVMGLPHQRFLLTLLHAFGVQGQLGVTSVRGSDGSTIDCTGLLEELL